METGAANKHTILHRAPGASAEISLLSQTRAAQVSQVTIEQLFAEGDVIIGNIRRDELLHKYFVFFGIEFILI